MFAEEIGGKTSRKKAEDAKEKRKRLKELQQKKAATTAKIASLSSTSVQYVPATPIIPVIGNTSVMPSNTFSLNATFKNTGSNILSPSLTSKPNSLSAVEIAAEQRQIRAKLSLQNRIVNKIQAIYRSYKVRNYQIELFTTELQKKLIDVETLHNMFLKKSSIYILPSSMATILMRQFLFISSRNMMRRKNNETLMTPLLCKLLDLVLIPGLESTNHDKNTILPWLDSSVGEYRLLQFLRLILKHYYSTHTEPCLKSIVRCLRALLIGTSKLQLHCRSLLLPIDIADAAVSPFTFDMMQIIRRQLLRMGDKPIPSNAESKRETCFTTPEKNRVGMMIQLLIDVITSQPNTDVRLHQARIVKDIFTIPLLGWRLSTAAISCITSPPLPTLSSIPPLMTLLEGFTLTYSEQLNNCEMEGLLDSRDLSMKLCPASGSQRLLANLLHLSRFIPACNGEVVTRLDFIYTAKFFRFIAALVDDVPIGTFISTRESTITWIKIDGNQKPVVLSPIILEQCKCLLVENYVRRMFLAAIDTQFLQTDTVLASKNDQDLKQESDWIAASSSSAASLAAKEARIDRNKEFWNSSNWARKLSKRVSNLLSSSETNNNFNGKKSIGQSSNTDSDLVEAIAAGLLQDTSSMSRQFAEGKQNDSKTEATKEQLRHNAYASDLLFALIQTYSILLARWGGGGNDDIVAVASVEQRTSGKSKSEPRATSTPDAWVKSILNVLCFSTPMVRVTWGIIQSDEAIVHDMHNLIEPKRCKKPIRSLISRPYFASSTETKKRNQEIHDRDGPSVFHFFLCTFSHVLIITDEIGRAHV